MILPVRCFTCGKPIADKYEEYAEKIAKKEPAGKVLDELGMTRYCCRRMFLSHIELIDEILPYTRF